MRVRIFTANNLIDASEKMYGNIDLDFSFQNYVVVPDRFSVKQEKRILEVLNKKSCFNVEVITLSRFAKRMLGEGIEKTLSKNASVMLVKKCIIENMGNLQCFKLSSRTENFAENIFETISQLKSCNVLPSELTEKNVKIDNLKIKLEDIKTIYLAYENKLENAYSDSFTKLKLLAKTIPGLDELKQCNMFFAFFDSYTPQVLKVVSELIKKCKSVNFALEIAEKTQKNAHIFPNDCYNSVLKESLACGVEPQIIKNYCENSEKTIQNFLRTSLYAYDNSSYLSNGEIKLFEGKTVSDEIDFIASFINKNVKMKVLRYNQFNIACCDLESYKETIKSVFKSYDIPVFFDTTYSLSNCCLPKLVLDVLNARTSNCETADFLKIANNSLLAFDNTKLNKFFNFLKKYNISHLKEKISVGQKDADYEICENLRKEIVNNVNFLGDENLNVEEKCFSILEFLYTEEIESLVENLSKKYEKNECLYESKMNLQSLQKLKDCLNVMAEILKDEVLSDKEFYDILKSGIDSVSLSYIPLSVDCVFVGDAFSSVFDRNDFLIVCGGSSQNFPIVKQDVGLISDNELKNLNEFMLIEPTVKLVNAKSRLKAVELVSNFKTQLLLTYSLISATGGSVVQSDIYVQIKNKIKVFNGVNEILLPTYSRSMFETLKLLQEKPDKIGEIYNYANPCVATKKMLKNLTNLHSFKQSDLEVKSAIYEKLTKLENFKTLENHLFKKDLFSCDKANNVLFANNSTKISQIESYFDCPFKNFMQNGIKIKENPNGKLLPQYNGVILHGICEKFVGEHKSYLELSEDEISQLTDKYFAEIIKENAYEWLVDNPDNKLLIADLKKEAERLIDVLNYQNQNSLFVPEFTELKFGMSENDKIEWKLFEKTLNLRGIVDRVDFYKNYFRIIDYKTGSDEFDLKELYCGRKVQLFIYQNAIRDKFGKEPAGVFYFPIANSFKNNKNKSDYESYKLDGLIETNPAVFAFDSRLSFDFSKSDIAPISIVNNAKTRENGEIQVKKSKSIVGAGELNELSDYSVKVSQKALSEMMENNISPSPLKKNEMKNACSFCPYAGVCEFDDCVNEFRVIEENVEISKEEDENAIK